MPAHSLQGPGRRARSAANSNAVRMDHCDTIDKLFFPLEEVDELVVHDQDERAPDAAEAVAEVALEEGLAALVLEDLLPAVHGALGE